MPLREEFENVGNWLFRWRSYLPIALALVLALGLRENRLQHFMPSLGWTLFCFAVSVLGLIVRVLTVGFTPKGTSGRNTLNQRADELNTSGIYSTVRHPLYLGNFLMWLGVSMYCQLWWLVAIVCLLFWLYYERIMFAEEEFLRRKFGESYVKWGLQTPAFIPSFKNFRKPNLPFSTRNVLKREYSGLLGMIAAFGLMGMSEHWVVKGSLGLDPTWQWICVTGVLLYVVLRTVRKTTSLFEVEGR
ncbi:MAG TPA: isoprenylcysteine carboxylmethyltransferase family protein [Pirellulales bacterium]|jgi:protein-S-isoprenylcysteine O-methyltransferase Ste14